MATVLLDGYSVKATIPPKGPWPEVKFTYRPMLATQVCEFLDNPKRGVQRLKGICKKLSEHVVEWDVRRSCDNDDADPLPITAENLEKLPMSYLNDMLDAVLSFSALEQEIAAKN